ncbi:MAG: Nitrite reductase [NAD(P)H] small subunit [uncultured Acidimicrobiales bacterium]|uniref:Nitrite reductase [NAD(P)H] small subunit n=1 Tax=uncultured Acidimicrobiales bacterium TaxID=310071 RepID=A0A6J4HNG4_9ACTN|nr:MAG: Nitrite reductase [NAD(P)H] small subunit [uncultured Acidimicrobiales bacterium]
MTILHPASAATTPTAAWHDVCELDRLTVERGVAALVDGRPVALFRLDDDEVVAVDDTDPFWGVPVLSRGLVGCVGGRDTLASPLLKQRFDLRTGDCLDDPAQKVAVWPVRVRNGRVAVAPPASLAEP